MWNDDHENFARTLLQKVQIPKIKWSTSVSTHYNSILDLKLDLKGLEIDSGPQIATTIDLFRPKLNLNTEALFEIHMCRIDEITVHQKNKDENKTF